MTEFWIRLWCWWVYVALCKNCPNTELFLIHIFPHSDWIWTRINSVFGHFSRSVGLWYIKWCIQFWRIFTDRFHMRLESFYKNIRNIDSSFVKPLLVQLLVQDPFPSINILLFWNYSWLSLLVFKSIVLSVKRSFMKSTTFIIQWRQFSVGEHITLNTLNLSLNCQKRMFLHIYFPLSEKHHEEKVCDTWLYCTDDILYKNKL